MKCKNCSWEGKEAIEPLNHCPVCGDDTDATIYHDSEKKKVQQSEPVQNLDYDINNDGVVDDKDVSLMAQKMGKISASKRKSANKKSKKKTSRKKKK